MRLTEALDVVAVEEVDELLQRHYRSDVAPGPGEVFDALADLVGSYALAADLFDSLDCVGADGDVLTALFVSWDLGYLELSGTALAQVLRHVSLDPLTGTMRAVL